MLVVSTGTWGFQYLLNNRVARAEEREQDCERRLILLEGKEWQPKPLNPELMQSGGKWNEGTLSQAGRWKSPTRGTILDQLENGKKAIRSPQAKGLSEPLSSLQQSRNR